MEHQDLSLDGDASGTPIVHLDRFVLSRLQMLMCPNGPMETQRKLCHHPMVMDRGRFRYCDFPVGFQYRREYGWSLVLVHPRPGPGL